MLELSPALYQTVRLSIDSGWVSVYVDPDGEFHEYTIMVGESALYLRRTYIGRDIEYMIEYDDHVVACITISSGAKAHTVSESEILQLFSLCSSRIIAQEMRTRILDSNQKQFS